MTIMIPESIMNNSPVFKGKRKAVILFEIGDVISYSFCRLSFFIKYTKIIVMMLSYKISVVKSEAIPLPSGNRLKNKAKTGCLKNIIRDFIWSAHGCF